MGRDACGKMARVLPPCRSEHLCVLGCDVFQVVRPTTTAPPEGPPVPALVGLEAQLPPPSVCPSPLCVDSRVGLVGSDRPSQLTATRCSLSFLGLFWTRRRCANTGSWSRSRSSDSHMSPCVVLQAPRSRWFSPVRGRAHLTSVLQGVGMRWGHGSGQSPFPGPG